MDRPPLEGFRMHNLRQDQQSTLTEKVMELWLAHRVLTETQARQRAQELLFIAIDERDERIAGVCTTYLRTATALKMPLWHFRTFVAPDDRQRNVAFHLLHHAIDFHESQFTSGADSLGRGLYMEIENKIIQQHRNEAIWPSSRMVFVGYNARGDHCRVRYFPGARIS